MPAEALLSATGITVVMGEKTLLNDVSVVARRGEVWASSVRMVQENPRYCLS